MMDTIIIKGLEVFANHGVLEEENRLGQKFIIDAELYTDFSDAVKNDDISASTDYSAVCEKVTAFMQENTFRLIETAAAKTACMLLDEFPGIRGVKLELKKPWAPIRMTVEYASVRLEKKWHTVCVALGSNIGDKEAYLNAGVKGISELKECRVLKVSDFIETLPYGNVGQADFLNGALIMETYLEPYELLSALHDIENSCGRKRTVHWGPRTLDLDIILYDSEIIDTPELVIPHYDMQNRKFVLAPLAQIAPYMRHPVLNKTISRLLQEL